MGTPDFAVPSLATLAREHEVLLVCTQPDRPSGRGHKLKASAVKAKALALGLPLVQPESIWQNQERELLTALQPDVIVVVAYGQILPPALLTLPKYGCVNVHASLLPLYRGAAPIHWAIMNGEKETGVTTMLMNEGLDTGDILLRSTTAILPTEDTGQLHDKLSVLGAELLSVTLAGLQAGTLKPQPQGREFSYAPKLRRADEQIDWTKSTTDIHNQIRGLSPWPGAFTTLRGKELKVWAAQPAGTQGVGGTKPGAIVGRSVEVLICATGDGFLELLTLQPAGRKKMWAADFSQGNCQIGECFA